MKRKECESSANSTELEPTRMYKIVPSSTSRKKKSGWRKLSTKASCISCNLFIPRHFTQADDVDLSSGVVIPSFALETKQEEPEEEKLDRNVDFERLLGGKEAKKAAKEEEKPRWNEMEDGFDGKRAKVQSEEATKEFVYTLKEQRNENWIRKGLEVKILNEKLANGK